MAQGTGDINLRPAALLDFAGNPAVDVDVEAVRRHAAAAMNGRSVMDEGNQFNEAHKKAIEQVMLQFETAKQGADAYRTGANGMFGIYTGADDQVAQTLNAVAPFAGGSADRTAEI
jgi:hypothetical protein